MNAITTAVKNAVSRGGFSVKRSPWQAYSELAEVPPYIEPDDNLLGYTSRVINVPSSLASHWKIFVVGIYCFKSDRNNSILGDCRTNYRVS